MTFLLAGLSVRALAQSAARAGHPVVAVDYFGDSDLADRVACRSLLRQGRPAYDAKDLPGLAAGLAYDTLAYVSNLENHPRVVRDLAGGRPIAGNTPETLRQARHWPTLRRVCAEEGLAMPPTLFPGEEATARKQVEWLRKPVKSGGGHGIDFWDGRPLARGWYLQTWVPGVSASAVFAANGRESLVLGVSEQVVGDRKLGAHGFRHCGNIMPLAPELGGGEALTRALADMAARLTRRFGLRGVCGLDCIIAAGPNGRPRPVLLEINPRPTASAELIEERGLGSVFDTHVRAAAGALPAPADWPENGGYLAKGIAFARRPCRLPEDTGWRRPELRDVGRPGDAIAPGRPICSIVLPGATRRAALEGLYAAARGLERDLASKEEAS
ncbi:MAG: ATP-grasp domain-containing protein [Solidesulfovibrio sp.]|uniref:ATP-grasp domain-containing protein n=1 Tax=Solidesulfovibrio sp. TaxID=2910990 RepID=UPI002B21FCC6|nr:ATP-grasp domain-containing protein [Solidesulfovibrio sp.]MEA4858827.1 ATP-grasp domain-containing protein [Solidesulfovibrio sp.]